ncbi:aldehyde dehydrogenase family protein [Hyphomonas sp. FCG-A18]|uniref:aldehyde dehydrogenase family protein n=1 Tax=Hyphomonas sp. FCG-A18 TaxID=3080019 RepID=UPI002B2CFBEF|nr:aldehyde dehydrogenase family protein [Hyphomonas sp. FCG-A18]
MTQLKARDPRTGEYDYQFEGTDRSALEAIASRQRATAQDWHALGLDGRMAKLGALADALGKHHDAIAAALEIDTGRRRIAGLEVDGTIGAIHGWLAQAPHLVPSGWTEGRMNPAIRHAPQFLPYALVGVISPWNFPLTLSMIDTIPALLAGCTVIVKPSEVTPRFVDPLRVAIAEAGLSDVLSFVQGDGATGAALIDTVDAICFTGSVPTGRKVAAGAAQNMIPAFLELGGKDPLIVLESSDLEAATDAALRSSVLSTGQACQSIERIYVQRSIHDAFLSRLVEKAEAARLNWPDITQGEIGPIIFDKQAAILEAHIEDAKAKGGRALTGGTIETHGGGLWLRPTVIGDATHEMKVVTQETFGPIMPVLPFDTVEDAIAMANDTEYGLSAAVFAGTLEEAQAVGEQIEAGAVSLNDAALTALFHEAEKHSFKLSGMGGSRMGPAGFQRFLRRKALIANTGAPAPLGAFAEDAQ